MTQNIDFRQEIYKRYGAITRANGCHLYTSKGVRLLDMYQEGGRAILGWRAGHAKQVFKNLLDRGITGSYDAGLDVSLTRAVRRFLPEYPHIRWYTSERKTRYACSLYFDLWVDLPLVESPVVNTSVGQNDGGLPDIPVESWFQLNGIPVWRPWLDDAWYSMEDIYPRDIFRGSRKTRDVVVMPVPFPWAGEFFAVGFTSMKPEKILPSDCVAAPLLGAAARAIDDLIAEIPLRSEKDWRRYDAVLRRYWQRRGPYLISSVPENRYADFFSYCLDAGILISPFHSIPSIVPFGTDDGEFTPICKNTFSLS